MSNAEIHKLDWNPAGFLTGNASYNKRVLRQLLQANTAFGEWDPLALAAKSNNEDIYTWEQAMNSPHAQGFKKAAGVEIDTLIKMGVWEEVRREPWMAVLPSTWAFRVKRTWDGTICKMKARFCARGDLQQANVHYDPFNIWSPVVSWTTVRLMLILSAQMELASRQVDYTAAFVHAPIDSEIYVEMPRGFTKPGKVLRLKKALYGLSQAPNLFFNFLKSKLERIGFEQAVDVDACLFVSPKVICITYVDDTLFFAKEMSDIDKMIRRLQEDEQMALEIELDAAGFLGVSLERDEKAKTVTL